MSVFKYYATNKPIFWTPNSEWKPNRDCFRRMIPENAWTPIPNCPVSWVDNFTIKTILQDPSINKWTVLRIEEYTNDLPNANIVSTKYFYLQATSKRLKNIAQESTANEKVPYKGVKRASEYVGTLDVWLTYGLDLIEKLSNDDKHPILVERFLHPRMFRKYLELKAFKHDDEMFNYESEEKVLAVSAQPQLVPAEVFSADKQFIKGRNIYIANFANQYLWKNTKWVGSKFNTLPNWACLTPSEESLTKATNWYYIVLANDDDASYTVVLASDTDTFLNLNYWNTDYSITGSPHYKATWAIASKDWVLRTLTQNRYNKSEGYWPEHVVGIYKADGFFGGKFTWTIVKGDDAGNYVRVVPTAYQLKPDDVVKNIGALLDCKSCYNKNLVNSFFPTGFIRLTSSIDDKQQVFQYGYLWNFTRVSGYDTVEVYPYTGIGAVQFCRFSNTDLSETFPQIVKPQNSIEPWVLRYEPTGDEPLNIYAMGRVKYWNTYLNPTFRWLGIDPRVAIHWIENGNNQYTTHSIDGSVININNDIYTNIDGIGFNGTISFTGNHWMFTTNGSWGFQVHNGNETLPLMTSSYKSYLASQRSQINTGLQIAKEQYSTQMKHLNINEMYNNAQGGLNIASNVLSGIADFFSGDLFGGSIRATQSAIDLQRKQEDTRYAKEQVENQYRHYNMKLNAQLADKRATAKPNQLLTSDSETIMLNALETLKNNKYFPFTYLWNYNSPTREGYEIRTVNPRGFGGFNSDYTNAKMFINNACCFSKLVNAPLDKFGRQFYNKLTWNVGMKGGFYATGLELFNSVFLTRLTEPTLLVPSINGTSHTADENQFYYLQLSITPDTIRQFAEYETLEVYNVLANMFTDGVRIWNNNPATSNRNFVITGALTKDYYDYFTERYQIQNPRPIRGKK